MQDLQMRVQVDSMLRTVKNTTTRDENSQGG
jgi:hypothetical protein